MAENGKGNIMNTATHDTHIAEYSATEAGLAELRERLTGVLYSVETAKGMEVAVRDRAELRGLRTSLERKRVGLKAPALDFTRRIDSEAKRITALLAEIEEPIDAVIKREESRKEEAKQARINAEFGRIAAIQEAIADIHLTVNMVLGKGSAAISTAAREIRDMVLDPAVFQELIEQAKQAQYAAIAKLTLMHDAALHVECEDAKLAAERAELAELRAAQAEAKRLDDETQKAEAAKLAEDKAEFARVQLVAAQAIAQQQAEIARQVAELEAASKPAPVAIEPAPVADVAADAPGITTGEICRRLGFMVTGQLIESFGFQRSEISVNKFSVWREADFRPICAALIRHIQGVAA